MTVEQAYREIRAYFSKPDAKFGFDTEAGVCQYRAFDHDTGGYRKCAVGVLIPDKLYDDSFEDGDTGPRELVDHGIINGLMTPDEAEALTQFLVEAQVQHDSHAIGKEYVPPKPDALDRTGTYIVKERTIPAFLRSLGALARKHGVTV